MYVFMVVEAEKTKLDWWKKELKLSLVSKNINGYGGPDSV